MPEVTVEVQLYRAPISPIRKMRGEIKVLRCKVTEKEVAWGRKEQRSGSCRGVEVRRAAVLWCADCIAPEAEMVPL